MTTMGLLKEFREFAMRGNVIDLAVGVVIGSAFGNHQHRRIDVAADQIGHDRGIDHPQTMQAMHAQTRIDHSHLIDSHLAGADWVIRRLAAVPYPIGKRVGNMQSCLIGEIL
jgi:hypothetical protein